MSNNFLTASLAFSTSPSVRAAANDRHRPADATSMVQFVFALGFEFTGELPTVLEVLDILFL
jgi:hypothetical protein